VRATGPVATLAGDAGSCCEDWRQTPWPLLRDR
jgi:hypothetical protein